MSDKPTIESLEASIREASLKHLQAETDMQVAIRALRETNFDVEKLTEKTNEYGKKLCELGVDERTIKGLVQKPEICGEGPYRDAVTKLYKEIEVNEEKTIYEPIIGGAFAFVRINNIGWGVLLRDDINRYIDSIRLGYGFRKVWVLTYEGLLRLTLEYIKDRIKHCERCTRQFNDMVSVVLEPDDQEVISEEKKS